MIALLFFSCSSSPDAFNAVPDYSENMEQANIPQPIEEEFHDDYNSNKLAKNNVKVALEPELNPLEDLKIIKTADYKFQVKDVDLSSKKIQMAVRNNSAYVSGMNMTVDAYQKNNNIVIRVPNVKFEDLMEIIGEEAEFTNHKRINTQDVSEEYVDIETRLKTKKEVKARYEAMLRSQAKTMEQVFHAEEKIRQLQEEIEAKEGRLRFLKDKVAFSTINLEIYQVVDLEAMAKAHERGFSDDFKDSFMNGWSIIMNILLAMTKIWPAILVVLGFLVWRWNWIKSLRA